MTTTTRISDGSIAAVRQFSPIDDVVGGLVYLGEPDGLGSRRGLCPFHEDTEPLFTVNPARGLWYCFACREGGDVIKYVQKTEGIGFEAAVELLAADAGIALEHGPGLA